MAVSGLRTVCCGVKCSSKKERKDQHRKVPHGTVSPHPQVTTVVMKFITIKITAAVPRILGRF